MTKIVVCHGTCSFCLSEEAAKLGRQISGNPRWFGLVLAGESYPEGEIAERFYGYVFKEDLNRRDPVLLAVVEQLGVEAASGQFARLEVAELAPGTKFRINETDFGEQLELEQDCVWEIA